MSGPAYTPAQQLAADRAFAAQQKAEREHQQRRKREAEEEQFREAARLKGLNENEYVQLQQERQKQLQAAQKAYKEGAEIRVACVDELERFQQSIAPVMPMPDLPDADLPTDLPAGVSFGYIRHPSGCRQFVDHQAGASYVLLPGPAVDQLGEAPDLLARRMLDEHMADYPGRPAPTAEICASVLILGYRHHSSPYRQRQYPGLGAASWARMELKQFLHLWIGAADLTGAAKRYAHLAPANQGRMPDGSMAAQMHSFVLVNHTPMPAREFRH